FTTYYKNKISSANSYKGGGSGGYYGSDPYRSREGLVTRTVSNNPDEIQLRIDPIHGDLDEEITGLHRQIGLLKNVRYNLISFFFSPICDIWTSI
ncbi:hypothetical protein IFM89_008185, partial [Coptis chinensis]